VRECLPEVKGTRMIHTMDMDDGILVDGGQRSMLTFNVQRRANKLCLGIFAHSGNAGGLPVRRPEVFISTWGLTLRDKADSVG
jgi:hypothetical protein